jgi:hypothetical protein
MSGDFARYNDFNLTGNQKDIPTSATDPIPIKKTPNNNYGNATSIYSKDISNNSKLYRLQDFNAMFNEYKQKLKMKKQKFFSEMTIDELINDYYNSLYNQNNKNTFIYQALTCIIIAIICKIINI